MPSELRVLRLITRLNIGGPATEIATLCREGASFGLRTLVVAGTADESEGDRFSSIDLGGADRVRLPHLGRTPGLVRDGRALAALRQLIRRWRPDVVHTHTSKAGVVGRLATTGLQRRPTLCHTYHGNVFRGYFGRTTSAVIVRTERWLGARTDAVIALGPRGAAELRRYRIGRRQEVIPPGFDRRVLATVAKMSRAQARLSLGLDPREPVVVAVGRLAPIKGVDVLLDAVAGIPDRRPTVLLVGDGAERAKLIARAQGLGLASSVRFLGWRNDVGPALRAADVFVLSSRNEGYPHAVVEAMAAGRPIVATDVGELRSFVPPSAVRYVPVDAARAFGEAIRGLLEDVEGRRRAGLEATRGIDALAEPADVAARTAALYRSLRTEGRSLRTEGRSVRSEGRTLRTEGARDVTLPPG